MLRPMPLRSSLLLLALTLVACGHDNAQLGDGGDPLDFVIRGIDLRVGSGTVRSSGGTLQLYLTDQPDACLAVTQTPTGAATFFSLRINPPTDGTTAAVIVAPKGTLAPGEAYGGVLRQLAGTTEANVATASGRVAWRVNPPRTDGTSGGYAIDTLDVGFEGTPERLTLGAVTVPACP